jgi:hypothetical protein
LQKKTVAKTACDCDCKKQLQKIGKKCDCKKTSSKKAPCHDTVLMWLQPDEDTGDCKISYSVVATTNVMRLQKKVVAKTIIAV